MSSSSRRWIWLGRVAAAVILIGLGVYLFSVGLENADRLASIGSLFLAAIALIAPYLFPIRSQGGSVVSDVVEVKGSGNATAEDGGHANTGIDSNTDKQLRVDGSGDAIAKGPGSIATTGIMNRPHTSKRSAQA